MYYSHSNGPRPPKKKSKPSRSKVPEHGQDPKIREPLPTKGKPYAHKPDFEEPHEQIDDPDPSICFVKAYARKPIGAPNANLIPLSKYKNGIDWNRSYFYNMMDN